MVSFGSGHFKGVDTALFSAPGRCRAWCDNQRYDSTYVPFFQDRWPVEVYGQVTGDF